MSLDGPSFLKNIGDTEEERDLLSPLTEDIKTVSPEGTPPADNPPADDSTPPAGDTPPTPPANPDGTPDAGDTPPKEETPPTPPVDTPPTQKIKYGEKEFESIEEFTAYTKKLEDSINKTENNEVPADDAAKKRLEALKSVPVIQAKLPLAESYYVDDGNGGKTFQMDEYISDVTNTLILGIQQALVQGPLAAAQFGMLKHALISEMNMASSEAQSEKQAVETTNKLYTDFPVLKGNTKLEKMVSRAIDGETIQREREAKASNTKPVPLTYEDLRGIITDILSNTTSTATQTEDPTEKLKSNPPMSGRETPVKTSQIDDDIDAMVQHKKSSIPGPGNFSF